jgi:hypothetical protein
MSEWPIIRWCIAIPFFFLWLMCFLGHISSIITVVTRGISNSVIPFIGGVSGALAFLIFPLKGSRRWFWVPLLLDVGAFAILAAILHHRSVKREKAHAKRTTHGE